MIKPNLIIPLACKCGVFLATAVGFEKDGLFLQVPPFLIREGQARCHLCGRVFHWNGHCADSASLRAMRYLPIDKTP